jgi:uncharacterized membrane protein YczE
VTRAVLSRRLLQRSALLVAGNTIATCCYALTIRASLGLGPLFVVQQGLARTVGMSIGHAVMVTGFACLLVAAALRVLPGPGTLVLPILGGFTLDAVLPGMPALHGLWLRLPVVVLATWLMALGGALVIRAAVGVAPYDAVMLGIRAHTGRSLRAIRLAMELTMLACGWLLGGSVGVGTVVTGLLIGPGMQFWLVRLGMPPVPRPAAHSAAL